MSDIIFYHAAPSRSAIVHWMLEEVGARYDMRLIDLKGGEQRRPPYLAINPMGKVPAILHRGTVVTEAAAICAYLADAFPAAGLAPGLTDPRRGSYFRWLFFGPTCAEAAIVDRLLDRPASPAMSLGYGDAATTFDTLAAALAPGPWLLGDFFTAADVVIGSDLLWGRSVGQLPDPDRFNPYLDRLRTRPALQRCRAEG
jgi:glutathione S-transferase